MPLEGHSTVLSSLLLRGGGDGDIVRPADSLIMSSLQHFFGCDVSPSIRSETLSQKLSIIMVDKTFHKSMDGFGKSIM